MLLTKIRLSGFKSFVDSAEIKLSNGLTGIVGPNGCGKSNIVDAVKWVLGESRVSELRSGNSKEVIFNGSGSRAAAGRASVELVFDNSDGALKGAWGGFSEISVQRTITSDGSSNLSINGQPVRKRDVQDLFSGTGLGPRAYAIVGQGSIKNIIEARPEELRFFVEETAGVSKYRTRRRETESRLRDSKANLLRVDDLIQELDKQIETLTTQAEFAATYQEKVRKKIKVECEILNCKEEDISGKVLTLKTALDTDIAKLKDLEQEYKTKNVELTNYKNKTFQKQSLLNKVTEKFHELNSEIIKKESESKLILQSIEQLSRQITEISTELGNLDSALNDEAIELANAENQLTEIDSLVSKLNTEMTLLGETIKPIEKELEVLDVALSEGNTQLALLKAEKANIDQKTRQDLDHIKDLEERLLASKNELKGISKQETLKLESLKQEHEKLKISADRDLTRMREERQSLVQIEDDLSAKNSELVDEESILLSSKASLEALSHVQEKELGSEKINDWLNDVGLGKCEKLISKLSVDENWNLAVETVLDRKLAAVVLESERQNTAVYGLNAPFGTYFVPNGLKRQNKINQDDRDLGSVISSDCDTSQAVKSWLKSFLLADTDNFAKNNVNSLPHGSYYITRTGNIYGQDLFFLNSNNQQASILSREKDIHRLAEKVDESNENCNQLRIEVDAFKRKFDEKKELVKDLSHICEKNQDLLHEKELSLAVLIEKNENLISREKALADNIEKLEFDKQRIFDRSLLLKKDLQRNEEEIKALNYLKEKKAQDRQKLFEALKGHKEKFESKIAEKNEKQFEQISRQEYIAAKNDKLNDIQGRKIELLERKKEYSRTKLEQENALKESVIEESLKAKAKVEKELISLRSDAERNKNQEKVVEREVSTLQGLIDEIKEESHSKEIILTEKNSLFEQIKNDKESKFAEFARHGTSQLDSEDRGKSLRQLEKELNNLKKELEDIGPVNLAAETEITSISQRREGLISQVADIRAAELELSQAIKKIDAETKDLLDKTMEQINKNLEFLFPKMFGGGQAELVLLEEDILTAGMAIQARLPGKKTMSIQSLSGGEKSMAAATLIFAFFLLNPAPFCLLDEVDAALDDANATKLGTLVVELSQKTQFIFITHNKISMEIADQLIGVTMREPGVSRIVSVDIESALSFTEKDSVQLV
ncbi:chromosome segregation protein SMC [Betaproteobacteria bacterium]|nr:chromosome segregation protein SMC [Betaproteobacteria bacterium]